VEASLARELVVHLSDGTKLTVSKENESDLREALNKASRAVLIRDNTGSQNIVNVNHIVRVELRS
jgi:hypothetical protein